MDIIKYLDPMYWLGEEGYSQLSKIVIDAVFNGVGARVLSATFLAMGLWFVFRRKLTGSGLIFISISSFIMFGQTIFRYIMRNWF